jgi:hypothetical protein
LTVSEAMIETGPAREITTNHRCLLGRLVRDLARDASAGIRPEMLAHRARSSLVRMRPRFEACCLPVYLQLAPEHSAREVQLPIVRVPSHRLEARVLVWPVGASDGQHPHCDGWAVFATATGNIVSSEQRAGRQTANRRISVWQPEILTPRDDVEHHLHNRGETVGLTIHVFGSG